MLPSPIIYIPFSALSVWSLTKKRLSLTNGTLSISDCVALRRAFISILPSVGVVAPIQDDFTSNPDVSWSTSCFVINFALGAKLVPW